MCQERVPTRNYANFTNRSFAPFILNGRLAKIKDYKFKLSLHVLGKFYCGASVISAKYRQVIFLKFKTVNLTTLKPLYNIILIV